MTKKEAESLVKLLIEAAFDSGYHSAKENSLLHEMAMSHREKLQQQVINALTAPQVATRIEAPDPMEDD